MNKPLGYNPMRWNCREKGKCYNETLRPRIEEFAGCFPGRVSFSDVDGIVELGGYFLLLEWKSDGGTVQGGQRIMYQNMTAESHRFTVIVVNGHPREMTVNSIQVFRRGKAAAVEPCDFEALHARVKAWADEASSRKTRPSNRVHA